MNKNYFDQFKKEISEEHTTLKSHLEEKELSPSRCDHKGKVQAIPGGVRCQCGAAWGGKNVAELLRFFTKGV